MDFKELWQKQAVAKPDLSELYAAVKQFKKSGVQRLWWMNISLSATMAFIIYVAAGMHNVMMSTIVGVIMILLSIVTYMIFSNQLFWGYKKLDVTQSNSEYLKGLIELKNRQKFVQTKILSLYFILLAGGLCVYMYEPTLRMTPQWRLIAYGLMLAWIAFAWFYLRPRTIKRQQAKIDGLIAKFNEVENQLLQDYSPDLRTPIIKPPKHYDKT